jgi:hypothetical protein
MARIDKPMSEQEKKELATYVTVIIVYNAADNIANFGSGMDPEESMAAAEAVDGNPHAPGDVPNDQVVVRGGQGGGQSLPIPTLRIA